MPRAPPRRRRARPRGRPQGRRASGRTRAKRVEARERLEVAAAGVGELVGRVELVAGGAVGAEVRRLAGIATDLVVSNAANAAARANSLVAIAKLLIDLRSEHERELAHERLEQRAEAALAERERDRRGRRRVVDGLEDRPADPTESKLDGVDDVGAES